MKVKLHSITDLITNSSTVIYTYSDASLDACKDMINEVFNTFNIDKTCDDVFDLSVGLESTDCYNDALSDLDEEDKPEGLKNLDDVDWPVRREAIDAYFDSVLSGQIAKPQWMKDAESGESYSGFKPSTTLYIKPKSPKYKQLATLISKFLYSTESDGGFDG